MLTETLRWAERDGLITRHLDARNIETATPYRFTDLGRPLDAPLAASDRWVEANRERVQTARQEWDRQTDHT